MNIKAQTRCNQFIAHWWNYSARAELVCGVQSSDDAFISGCLALWVWVPPPKKKLLSRNPCCPAVLPAVFLTLHEPGTFRKERIFFFHFPLFVCLSLFEAIPTQDSSHRSRYQHFSRWLLREKREIRIQFFCRSLIRARQPLLSPPPPTTTTTTPVSLRSPSERTSIESQVALPWGW